MATVELRQLLPLLLRPTETRWSGSFTPFPANMDDLGKFARREQLGSVCLTAVTELLRPNDRFCAAFCCTERVLWSTWSEEVKLRRFY